MIGMFMYALDRTVSVATVEQYEKLMADPRSTDGWWDGKRGAVLFANAAHAQQVRMTLASL